MIFLAVFFPHFSFIYLFMKELRGGIYTEIKKGEFHRGGGERGLRKCAHKIAKKSKNEGVVMKTA